MTWTIKGGSTGELDLCTKPDEYGHTRRRRTSYRTPEEQARDDAEEQAEAERRRTREVAADARLGFLAELISAAKAPARHHRLTGAALWTAERTIRAGHRELVAALLGVTPGDGDRWADAEELDTAYARYVDNLADQRGWRLSLAHAVAVCEANLRDIGRWNFRADLAVVWLDWLVESAGLGRAPVEEELRAEAEAALAPGPAGEGEGQARSGEVLDECPDCGEVECDACDGGPPVEDVHLPDAEDGQEGGQAA